MRHVVADCLGGGKPGWLLVILAGLFQAGSPVVQVQLESVPPGADAKTSSGPACKTPCQVAVPADNAGFQRHLHMNKFLPVTVPVQVINIPGDFSTPASTTLEPNPVFAELRPAGPPPKPARTKSQRPKAKKPPPAPAAASPFPAPPPPAR